MSSFKDILNCCFPSNRTTLKICDQNALEDESDDNYLFDNPKIKLQEIVSSNVTIDQSKCNKEVKKIEMIIEEDITNYQFDSVEKQQTYALSENRQQFFEEPFLPFLNDGRIISSEDNASTPCLYIFEDNPETTNKILSKEVIINASGLIGSQRKSNDGIVIFCKKEAKRNSSFLCDYEFEIVDDLFYLPYVFAIYSQYNGYFICPHQSKGYDNYLPLILLSKDIIIPIKDKEIFSIGSITLLICMNLEGMIEITNVGLFGSEDDKKPKMWSFDKSKKEITIGKGKNCDLSFPEDKVLSRIHSTLYYEGNTWIMKDGYNGKNSTNGTFLFCLKAFRILNNMTIRLLSSDLLFTFKTNSNNNN